ncbi:NTP transferase domain-containing protein [Tardiphaga sp.]|uniref:phosphocholine cytidylyltransferase family protein n=1 Tax=Tardiphaga sp. TaxID=1926292 RepID=UPI003529D838
MPVAEIIDTAIVLAAGEGQRLRTATPIKPLCIVAGQVLLARILDGLVAAGMRRAIVVLGYEAAHIAAFLNSRRWPLEIELATVDDYRRPNGVSALAARPHLRGASALLVMADHLVDVGLYRLVAREGPGDGVRLATDRRLDNPDIDITDVTRVKTRDGRIVAIGKMIPDYDCFDTGVFAVSEPLFEALDRFDSPSLTDGVRALASLGLAFSLDCGDLDWIDVDDELALRKAEEWIRCRSVSLGPLKTLESQTSGDRLS